MRSGNEVFFLNIQNVEVSPLHWYKYEEHSIGSQLLEMSIVDHLWKSTKKKFLVTKDDYTQPQNMDLSQQSASNFGHESYTKQHSRI